MNRRVITLVVVLGIGMAIGAFFLANRDPGVAAEIVEGPAAPVVGTTAAVVVCIPGQAPGDPGLARAVVQINQSTELLDQRKRSPARFQPEDLRPGSRIRLWSSGQMLLSEPPQLSATRMSLLSDPVDGRVSLCAP
jgi:hypothetical protein